VVAQFGDKTYLATVTMQTTAADNPTYVRDCHDNPQGIPGAAARRGQPLLSRRMPARWRRGAVGDVLTAQLGFDEFLGERVLVTVDLNTAAGTRRGRAAPATRRCSGRRSTRTARRSMGQRRCGSPTPLRSRFKAFFASANFICPTKCVFRELTEFADQE